MFLVESKLKVLVSTEGTGWLRQTQALTLPDPLCAPHPQGLTSHYMPYKTFDQLLSQTSQCQPSPLLPPTRRPPMWSHHQMAMNNAAAACTASLPCDYHLSIISLTLTMHAVAHMHLNEYHDHHPSDNHNDNAHIANSCTSANIMCIYIHLILNFYLLQWYKQCRYPSRVYLH